MRATPEDLQAIIGKRPWRVWKGFGSFLLFEFGRRYRNEDGSQRGAYTLWIYMVYWRIWDARDELAHSESPDESICQAADALTGKRLEGIVLNTVILKRGLRFGALFRFEDGYSLRAYQVDRSTEDKIFILSSPEVHLSYRSDGTLLAQRATDDKRSA